MVTFKSGQCLKKCRLSTTKCSLLKRIKCPLFHDAVEEICYFHDCVSRYVTHFQPWHYFCTVFPINGSKVVRFGSTFFSQWTLPLPHSVYNRPHPLSLFQLLNRNLYKAACLCFTLFKVDPFPYLSLSY